MSTKTKYLCLIGVLIVAGFFRFYHLTSTPPGLYMDEAMDGVNAQNVAQTGNFKVYYPEDNGREGLYVNILALAFKYHILPDNAPWSVRFPAAAAGTLTVLGLYLLILELFKGTSSEKSEKGGENVALLSSLFLAASFWHINFSRIGFRAILAPFCLVWASWFLFKMIRAGSRKKIFLYGLLGGIIYGLGFYTYIAFRITPLLLLIFIPFFRREPGFWKRICLFLFVTFLVALPIGWYYLHNPSDFLGRTSQISVSQSANPAAVVALNALKTALMFNWHGDYNWRHNLSGAPELFWPVGVLFLVGILLGIYAVFKQSFAERLGVPRFALLFLFGWFVLGALPEILSNDGIPHALRSLLMVIPAVAFAALGALSLYALVRDRLNPGSKSFIVALFVALVLAGAYQEYFKSWSNDPNVPGAFNADYVAIGDRINALPPAAQKYVVVYAGGVIDYGLPMPAEPVLYVTRSFVPDAAAQKTVGNIHYLLPSELDQIPKNTPNSAVFEIR